jgi:hypothetical protein
MNTLDWLLNSDPAIRWQAMRDLTDASPAAIAAERARVPREGIGAEILACQGSDGSWHRDGSPDWLPTLFTMQLLRATGGDPTDPAVSSAISRLNAGFRWAEEFGAKPFFEGEVEPCINGGALAAGSYFGHPSETLARRLLSERLEDGGWNCDAGLYPENAGKKASTRSSFHTTICVLEGLLEYERAARSASGSTLDSTPAFIVEVAAARRRAEEYLLKRALFRRLSTGAVAHPAFVHFAFPPRYHYDVLRALDYFRTATLHNAVQTNARSDAGAAVQNSGAPSGSLPKNRQPDPRLAEALQLVESKRQPDGRWLLDAAYGESLAIPPSESIGEPSRWNTLRALRVLRWACDQP